MKFDVYCSLPSISQMNHFVLPHFLMFANSLRLEFLIRNKWGWVGDKKNGKQSFIKLAKPEKNMFKSQNFLLEDRN